MSRSDRSQCSYTYEPPETITPDDRVDIERPSHQRCPYEAVDPDEQRCLYHHGSKEYPSDRFTEQFLESVETEDRVPTFAGGYLSGLELRGETIKTPNQEPIDLRGAVIDGDVDLTNATLAVPLLLDGAAITGSFEADNATFQAPVSLVDADISGRMHWHDTLIEGGLVANDLNAGYVDARELTVDGPAIFRGASFSSNLLLARANIDGDLVLDDTTFDWNVDCTSLTAAGVLSAIDMTVDADFDLLAGQISDHVEFRQATINGETDCRHAEIGGELIASDCRFNDEAIFDGLTVDGTEIVFDGTVFEGKADFSTLSLPNARASFSGVTFDGEVWFTHSTIGDRAIFNESKFQDMAHLRDALFEDDLSLRNVVSTGQFFLHGSTIKGDLVCSDAHFEHFQFSATVAGKSEFNGTQFEEKALFQSSTFGDRVWFDDVLFSGHPDFSDTRFTDKTTFDGAEFLVDPTFEDARFAMDPDLSVAQFPMADAIDFEDRKHRMILAHPESLQHEGKKISRESVRGDITVPATGTHLVEDDIGRTKAISKALSEFDRRSWHDLIEGSLQTARTAVAQLPSEADAMLVFGLEIDAPGEATPDLIDDAMIAGVYYRQGDQVVFGHLDPTLLDMDYLVPVPATDEAFESGAAVATSSELLKAVVRNEMFRAVLLGKQNEEDPAIHQNIVPVLVGAGTID